MRAAVEFSEIPRDECLQLLSQRSVGRLAIVRKGRPLIFPVNYALQGEVVVFRTDPGQKLLGSHLRKVAFEVDEVDDAAGTGWSVLLQGYGYEITNAIDDRSRSHRELRVTPMVPGEPRHWIEIIPETITGRRIAFRVRSVHQPQ